MTIATDTAAAVRAAYDAFGRGDIPAVLALLDPEVEWIEAEGGPYGGTYRGPQAVLEGVFGRIGGEWSTFEVVPDRLVTEGDTVAALGTYRGVHGTTGRSMAARFVHIWELRDGRLVRWEQVVDSAVQNAAMS